MSFIFFTLFDVCVRVRVIMKNTEFWFAHMFGFWLLVGISCVFVLFCAALKYDFCHTKAAFLFVFEPGIELG